MNRVNHSKEFMAADSRFKKLGNHISIHTQEVREKEQQVGKSYQASKPIPQ